MELLSDQDVAGRPRRATGCRGRRGARSKAAMGAERGGEGRGAGRRTAVSAGSRTRTSPAASDGMRRAAQGRGGAGGPVWIGWSAIGTIDRPGLPIAWGRSGCLQHPERATRDPRAPATRDAQRPGEHRPVVASLGADAQDRSLTGKSRPLVRPVLGGPPDRTFGPPQPFRNVVASADLNDCGSRLLRPFADASRAAGRSP
jgi:hypothetical protein